MIKTAPKLRKKPQHSGSMHITKKVDYGLVFLVELAQSKIPLSIQSIAKAQGAPYSFLQKLAQDLQQANLIKSTKGAHGGYSLKKTPSKINLKEIIEALEGPITLTPCLRTPCNCGKNCRIKSVLTELNLEIATSFAKKNLNHFLT
ncbi:Rrf2 family transcriptional regulator [Patescibacteria group bacterium]|nr:Rrf2 family transcriptional regulator [Patescibacteria group bacterium]